MIFRLFNLYLIFNLNRYKYYDARTNFKLKRRINIILNKIYLTIFIMIKWLMYITILYFENSIIYRISA